ncbi:MAG: four-carbon acid sugar kinase family protein [Desulfobacterales bacterium]
MNDNNIHVAVVADDLTGAADTGVQFCSVAEPFDLLPWQPREWSGGFSGAVKGLAVFTNSRHDSPPAAARKVRRVADLIRRHAPRVVYKKIDSCLRGNLGSEIDALLESLECPVSFIAPALPGQERTTENDVHRVRGVPVAESEIALDPLCPVSESRLSRLLAAQSRYPVGRVGLEDVAAGSERLRAAIGSRMAEGCRHIAFDATETVHLDAIAAAATRFFTGALLVGSAGLAASQASWLGEKTRTLASLPTRRLQRMLWVCGSATTVSLRQAEALRDRSVVAPIVLPAAMLADAESASGRKGFVDQVIAGWSQGVRMILIEPLGKGPHADPALVVAGLGAIVADIVRLTSPEGLFLTGGDTAEAVWRCLGAAAIRLEGEVLPGVIRGRWIGGAMNGGTVITKAGAFGDPETLLNLYSQSVRGVTQ